MDHTANEQDHWSLQGNVARLTYDPLSGEVDTARPYPRLCVPELCSNHGVFSPLGAIRSAQSLSQEDVKRADEAIWWPLPVAETYVRGNDLVATYRPTESWPYSPQLYWRIKALDAVEGVVASISLLVSVQTQLLETCPQISVVSQSPTEETLCIAIDENGKADIESIRWGKNKFPVGAFCCVLRRLSTATLSYVEIASSPDYFEVQIRGPNVQGDCLTEWRLFADFLEKGVIRRARVHGALVLRKNDLAIAAECCKAIARLELPLTT